VLINGRLMKQHGRVLHVDWPAVMRMVDESRSYVLEKSGFRLPKI
jgi:transposase-like protein